MMRGGHRLVVGLVVSQLCLSTALADPLAQSEALDWLQRIASAARDLNYTGIFVYQHGDQSETSRITHVVDRNGEHEKLLTLDGPRREIIRNSSEIITYYADSGLVKRERRAAKRTFPALLPQQLSALTEYYEVRKGGRERIAGHDAQALILRPKDGLRYGHKLWADVGTGLLLKAKLMDDHHQQLELFQFTQLTIGGTGDLESVKPDFPIPPSMPAAPSNESTAAAADTGWVVRNPPPGFRKIMEMLRARPGKQGSVAHLVYSDGLAAVSVFLEARPAVPRAPGPSSQGAVNIYTRVLPAHLVTVLGEVPPATLEQIADSVDARGK